MNRRQFLPLFAAPAVVALPELPLKLTQPIPGYTLTWREACSPHPNNRGIVPATTALLEQLKLSGATILNVEDYHVDAELSFSSFLSATAFKVSLIKNDAVLAALLRLNASEAANSARSEPPNQRIVQTARIDRDQTFQPPTTGYKVSWQRESNSSWDDKWPFHENTTYTFSTYDEVYEYTQKHNIQIVQQDEQADTIPLWTLEQYFNTEAAALDRYQAIEQSERYNRDSLKLERI